MSSLMNELVGLWLLVVLVAWVIYELRHHLKWHPTDSLLLAGTTVMHATKKDPHREQEPSPEPIDPPSDVPLGDEPIDPLDRPNA